MKNILKKILNKKKSAKKTKVTKKAKITKKIVNLKKIKNKSKSLKVNKSIKNVKSSKLNKKNIKKNVEVKSEPLRISKNNEQKPEIKKIRKQETEKKQYKIKEYVVYPKHGVGQITEIKKINIGGIDVETYVLKFEKDKANGMVPVNKQIYLRPLATINQVNKCISILKGKQKIKRSMWSRRAQE
jgi:Transcriptional regulators, similar to M. xanthus CarD